MVGEKSTMKIDESKAERLKEEIRPKVDIERTASVLYDGRQYSLKIPREVISYLKIKKGDKINFIIRLKQPPEQDEKVFEVIQNG